MGMLRKLLVAIAGLSTLAVLGLVTSYVVNAATTADSTLSQAINAGVLSTDIRDAGGSVLSNPTFGMSAVSVSTTQQTATGTFGSNSQRITVDNPAAAVNGWTLALNATTPGTGTWTSGANTYAYNGATAAVGQLTVNPAAGTLTPVVGTSTGVTLGTSSTFTASTAITLVSAASGSDDIWNGYVTGISLSQTIPAAKPAGTYTLAMTQTVTAL